MRLCLSLVVGAVRRRPGEGVHGGSHTINKHMGDRMYIGLDWTYIGASEGLFIY